MTSQFELSPLQIEGVEWLKQRERGYLADCAGFGKTREFLAAVGECRLLVVCPAAIRDAKVWPGEAARIGWSGDLTVISYHQLARVAPLDYTDFDAVVFDEAHRLKDRKVSWSSNAQVLTKRINRVYLGSGTPTPNNASELWAQLRLIRPDMPAYWPWIRRWFLIEPTEHTQYSVPGVLKTCVLEGCHNGIKVRNEWKVREEDCEHWEAFRQAEQEPWMFGRGEELLDLPPMSGADVAQYTPMTTKQASVYRDLREDYLAVSERLNLTIEAMTDSERFQMLRKVSTGISAQEPAGDPEDRESGKLRLLREKLEDRRAPMVAACWYRNTALAIGRLCDSMGKTWVPFGGTTSSRQRQQAIERFQAGEIDVLVGSVEVIKEGLTLTTADNVTMVERAWVPSTNHQIIRRVQRRGQTKSVTVDQLVTPRTVDDGQWVLLHDKAAMTDKVDVRRLIEGKLTNRQPM